MAAGITSTSVRSKCKSRCSLKRGCSTDKASAKLIGVHSLKLQKNVNAHGIHKLECFDAKWKMFLEKMFKEMKTG